MVDLELLIQHAAARSKVSAILSPTNPYVIPQDASIVGQTLVEMAQYIKALELQLTSKPNDLGHKDTVMSPSLSKPNELASYANSDAYALLDDDVPLSDHLKLLTLDHSNSRFFGTSSNVSLVKAAIKVRKESTGHSLDPEVMKRPEFWNIHPVRPLTIYSILLADPTSVAMDP